MSGNQLARFARKGSRLLLDIDHPKGSLPSWFRLQPLAKPPVDNLETLHWCASGGIAPVKTVQDKELVRGPVRSTDDIYCRHAAPGMSAQDKAIHHQCIRQSSGASQALQAVVYQPINAS